MTTTRPRPTLLALVVALVATFGIATSPAASAAPQWADADEATITPGVQMFTNGAQCTANFVFTQGDDLLLGYAAHCAGTGGQTDTNGCLAGSLPLGTPVEIDGATQPGTLVYSSWAEMAARGETDADACSFNDFALVEIHPDDHDAVNPSVPVLGGPVALGGATAVGEQVYNYGNSSLRFGLAPLSPKTGVSLGTSGNGWTHTVYTVTPGVPGDSGSGFLDSTGNAFGVTSTLALAPFAASNGISDLALALDYANADGDQDVALVPGTEAFVGYP